MYKITSNDKVSIRAMAMIIKDFNSDNTQILKRINTGSNIYTIICSFKIIDGIIYSVIKTSRTGKYLGEEPILKISKYELEYNNRNGKFVLPNSVIAFIMEYNKNLKGYMKYGEKYFK